MTQLIQCQYDTFIKSPSKIYLYRIQSALMYIDMISYRLADGISQAHLMEVAEKVVKHWMADLPGFISWTIHQDQEGNYTDIVRWQSAEAAADAHKGMADIPDAGDWYACYMPGTITSKNLTELKSF